jgi:hypothetical protein
MAVAVVAAVAHSLPHASVDAIVPEPDFYETGAVNAVETELLATGSGMDQETDMAIETELLATGSGMDQETDMAIETALLATGSGMDQKTDMAIETALLATGSGMAQETELLAAGSGLAGGSGPEAPDCDKCIHEFANDGGCDAWAKKDWDAVHAAVPKGCYPCGDEAAQHCGIDSHSAVDFLEAMRAIDNDHKEAILNALFATGSGMAQETELLG